MLSTNSWARYLVSSILSTLRRIGLFWPESENRLLVFGGKSSFLAGDLERHCLRLQDTKVANFQRLYLRTIFKIATKYFFSSNYLHESAKMVLYLKSIFKPLQPIFELSSTMHGRDDTKNTTHSTHKNRANTNY